MKNQYFADINDYRKYGLLRTFQSTGIGKLLVAWMLTPDDGRQDGRSRSYLKEARSWRRYDPELYERLVFLKYKNLVFRVRRLRPHFRHYYPL